MSRGRWKCIGKGTSRETDILHLCVGGGGTQLGEHSRCCTVGLVHMYTGRSDAKNMQPTQKTNHHWKKNMLLELEALHICLLWAPFPPVYRVLGVVTLYSIHFYYVQDPEQQSCICDIHRWRGGVPDLTMMYIRGWMQLVYCHMIYSPETE